jgi:hypothetical protein
MHFEAFSFGSIRIDGITYEHDGYRPRASPQAQEEAIQNVPQRLRTHPLSIEEEIPWKCRRLVIGTRYRSAADYGRSETRGPASQDQIIHRADDRGYRGAETNA